MDHNIFTIYRIFDIVGKIFYLLQICFKIMLKNRIIVAVWLLSLISTFLDLVTGTLNGGDGLAIDQRIIDKSQNGHHHGWHWPGGDGSHHHSVEENGNSEKQKYLREHWPNVEADVAMIREWIEIPEHADEILKVLLYVSRLDEPIYIGMDLLNLLDGKHHILLKRIEKMCKKSIDYHQTDQIAVSFMLGQTGIVPLYVEKDTDDQQSRDMLEEQVQMGKLIREIVVVAMKHGHDPDQQDEHKHHKHRPSQKRRLFHRILGEVVTQLKHKKGWTIAMKGRIIAWEKGVHESLRHMSWKKVAIGLKDMAIWMCKPDHIIDMIQIILYFTHLSAPVKIPLEIISALGIDEIITKMAAKMGVKLIEHGTDQRLAMWMFGPNGLIPLFVRQGDRVDSTEVMNSIDMASIWRYFDKIELGGYDHIICLQKVQVAEGVQEKCSWHVDRYTNEDEEETERKMEQHLREVHPEKAEQKEKAQAEKNEIIKVADIWYYFDDSESENGRVKCKLMVKSEFDDGTKGEAIKCDWSIEKHKATEKALNDHLSLDHLAEFEQRLKANREKDLPIRHLPHKPLDNALTFFSRINASLAMNKGKPMHHLVDIMIDHLRHWEHRMVNKLKRRWERVKRVQFRDVRDKFKHAAMWLITPKHINNVLNVIFTITKLDGPIYLTMELMKAFGITRYIIKMLDKQSLKVRKRWEGTKFEKALLFVIGENGLIRLFLNIGAKSIVGTAEESRGLTTSGTVEFLNTVITTVVQNPAHALGALVMMVMDKARDLRLEISLVRLWNQNWDKLKNKFDNIKHDLQEKRIEELSENVRKSTAFGWLNSRQTTQDVTKEDDSNTREMTETSRWHTNTDSEFLPTISEPSVSTSSSDNNPNSPTSTLDMKFNSPPSESSKIVKPAPRLTKMPTMVVRLDCPAKLYEKHNHIQFGYVLDRAIDCNCKTIQTVHQKLHVVENFVDQAVETIMKEESEALVPPLIHIHFSNTIRYEHQQILKKIHHHNVLFLYQIMAQAGVKFDCTHGRPMEFIFEGPNRKKYILLLPGCARQSGKMHQFAIFRMDYFDDRELEEAEDGAEEGQEGHSVEMPDIEFDDDYESSEHFSSTPPDSEFSSSPSSSSPSTSPSTEKRHKTADITVYKYAKNEDTLSGHTRFNTVSTPTRFNPGDYARSVFNIAKPSTPANLPPISHKRRPTDKSDSRSHSVQTKNGSKSTEIPLAHHSKRIKIDGGNQHHNSWHFANVLDTFWRRNSGSKEGDRSAKKKTVSFSIENDGGQDVPSNGGKENLKMLALKATHQNAPKGKEADKMDGHQHQSSYEEIMAAKKRQRIQSAPMKWPSFKKSVVRSSSLPEELVREAIDRHRQESEKEKMTDQSGGITTLKEMLENEKEGKEN